MNLQGEMNKPVLVTEGGETISLREFKDIRFNAINESAFTRALSTKHVIFWFSGFLSGSQRDGEDPARG